MSVKTCTGCENNAVQGIPFIVYEKEMTRYERVIKKLWILIILLIVLLVGSNIVWIVYENQFENVSITQEVEQDAESGENHFIGGDFYGETDNKNNNQKTSS